MSDTVRKAIEENLRRERQRREEATRQLRRAIRERLQTRTSGSA